jgi:hypothetical protein
MSETKKVTEQELQQLQSIRNESDRLIIELGRINYEKIILQSQEENIKDSIIILQQKELEFSNELIEKYGKIKVDIESGDII